MAQVEISCSQCGSNEYQLVNAQTGEVACRFCRNQWIESALIQKSETEKFLEEQAKQPRVIYDNTTETDDKILGIVRDFSSGRPMWRANKILRRVIIIAVIIVVLIVACLLINIFGGLRSILG